MHISLSFNFIDGSAPHKREMQMFINCSGHTGQTDTNQDKCLINGLKKDPATPKKDQRDYSEVLVGPPLDNKLNKFESFLPPIPTPSGTSLLKHSMALFIRFDDPHRTFKLPNDGDERACLAVGASDRFHY